MIIPFSFWVFLTNIDSSGKSLANLLVETIIIGCIAPAAPIIRVIISKKLNKNVIAIVLLLVLNIIALGLWMFVPWLAE